MADNAAANAPNFTTGRSKAEPTTSLLSPEAATGQMTFQQALQQTSTEAQQEDANIFVAAQRGDVALISRLLESGEARATDVDAQNITPLHWAAINAQLPACRLLLSAGADPDALGGDLIATPLQWAARNGYTYIMQLLIHAGADPMVQDAQGYNALHLVTHSSGVMALLYILQHVGDGVDSRDAQGHTSLMWAAYQGDALSVELLLKHGASVTATDEGGLTPLHWAVVKANRVCIRRIVERGADLNTKDSEGRTAQDMAKELKSEGAWRRALAEGGMDANGVKRGRPLSERNTKIAIFVLPTIALYLIFMTLSILPWYTGIILAIAEFFGMHHIVTRVLLNGATYADSAGSVSQSPYFAGIIAGSIVWVMYAWLSRIIGQTQSHALSHLIMALSIGLCAYNFFRAITLDAGTCPAPSSDAELKSIIEELASEGRLNGQTFCMQCMGRKPLRSKHCRVCEKCVARSDHHCPWIWNCVGSNNHRQFLLFVITLVIGVVTFDYLTVAYFSTISLSPSASPSCPLPSDLCAVTHADPFLVSVAVWATLQLSWTVVLLASQLWQVARQMTSLEVSNLGRYGFMGGRGGAGLGSQMGHHHQHAQNLHGEGAGAGHNHSSGCGSGFLMKLLGFDRFTKGKAVDGLARAGTAKNPFDLGFVGNCKDFWTAGRELGVQYERLYDVPPEGFREAKRRREEEHEADGSSRGSKSLQQTLFMRMGFGAGRGSRAGYEPVSQV